MGTVERFEDLEIWQLARELVRKVYEVTRKKEFSKDFSLKDQIRRSSVSIMNNISEGFESQTTKLFIYYLGRSKGSSGETRSVLYVALDCKYITDAEFLELYELSETISKKTQKFIQYLKDYDSRSRIQDVLIAYNID